MIVIIKILTAFCLRLSFDQAVRWGRGLGGLLGSVLRYRRSEVIHTIQFCFPEKTETEARAIADGMYRHLGQLIVEALRLDTLDRDWFDRHVEVTGVEIIREALKRGKGAIMLTAHIGNFELQGMIGVFLEIPLTIIAKPFKPPALYDYWVKMRLRFGVKTVPPRGTWRACLTALKNNEILGFILDQNMKRDRGIFVDFFGRPACTSPGLALLSAMAGSPVIPVFITRRPDGGHRIEVLPFLEPPPDRNRETIRQATQTYTAIIESMVRKHPDQWIWLHRRWRTTPLPETQVGSSE